LFRSVVSSPRSVSLAKMFTIAFVLPSHALEAETTFVLYPAVESDWNCPRGPPGHIPNSMPDGDTAADADAAKTDATQVTATAVLTHLATYPRSLRLPRSPLSYPNTPDLCMLNSLFVFWLSGDTGLLCHRRRGLSTLSLPLISVVPVPLMLGRPQPLLRQCEAPSPPLTPRGKAYSFVHLWQAGTVHGINQRSER